MYKIDLHTHSEISPDGGLTEADYRRILDDTTLHCLAVTDHNSIDFAVELQKKLGEECIIVGEEIMTSAGEIIGLYLTKRIEPGLTPLETVKQIKEQNGIVYIPHPFETVRKGLHPAILDELIDYVDLIEVCNGRALFQNKGAQAAVWSKLNRKTGVASSDAHGYHGIGRTFTQIQEKPTRDTILEQLAGSIPRTNHPTVRALLYPKYHRLRRKISELRK